MFEGVLGLIQALAGEPLDSLLLPGKAREYPLIETVENSGAQGGGLCHLGPV